MKELHLDIELAKSELELKYNTSKNSSSIKDDTIESRSLAGRSNELDASTGQEISHIDMTKGNVHLSNLDKVSSVTMKMDHVAGNGTKVTVNSDKHFSECRDTDLRAKVNTAFVPDIERHSTLQTNEEKSSGAEFGERPVDQAVGANHTDGVVKTFDDSKAIKKSLCDDPVFRNKMFKTIFLLWNATCLGWGYGQMGPVFPDLQDLAGVSLQKGSWLFTGFAIGYLGGCLLGGFTQSRFNPNLMLFLYTLVSASSFALLPWIPIFPVMVFLRVLNGIGIGGQDTGFLTMLFAIWGNKVGPVNQIIYVLFAFGGIVSPLVSEPFLRKVIQNNQFEASNSTESTLLLNSTVTVSSFIDKDNDTAVTGTNVHYALLISALLFLSAAVPFIVAFIKESKAKTVHQKCVENTSTEVETKLPKDIEKIILFILFLIAFVATACTDLFPSFLTTFLMEQSDWTQQDGSTLTSLFFAMFAVGNFINIFVSIYVRTTKIVVFSYVSSVIMLSGILISVVFTQTELIWATVSLSGAAMSNILPTLYTWTQEFVTPITAAVASGLLISGSLGISLNPLLVGYMMEVYSPMWFIYLSLGNIAVCALLFFTAMILSKKYSISVTEDRNEKENNKNDTERKPGQIDIYLNGYLQNSYEITHL